MTELCKPPRQARSLATAVILALFLRPDTSD